MSPEGYVRACWQHLGAGAPGLNFVDSTGRYYYKTCRGCRARIRHYSSKKDRFVCGKCGADWPYEDRILAKGVVQRTRQVDLGNEKMSRTSGIVVLLDRFIHEEGWIAKIFVVKVVTDQSYEEMAKAGRPKGFRGFPKPWSPKCISDAVRDGRAEWARRLAKAGL